MAEASAATTILRCPSIPSYIVVAALASAMLVDMVFPTLQQP